jgi:hypothetical protein
MYIEWTFIECQFQCIHEWMTKLSCVDKKVNTWNIVKIYIAFIKVHDKVIHFTLVSS